jgi:hypothetical protein
MPGQEGARRFAARFHQQGAAEVRVVKLPYEVSEDHGKDLRDWLNEGHGTEDFLRLVDAAQVVTADEVAAWAKPVRSNQQERPPIVIGVDEPRVVDQAIAALSRSDAVYRRGGMLVQVVRDAEPPKGIDRSRDAPRIVDIRLPRLRELLADVAEWMNPVGGGKMEPAHPAEWAVKATDARGQWQGIRRLEGVVEVPTLRADGSVLQIPGYDPMTGLLYDPHVASRGFLTVPGGKTRSGPETSCSKWRVTSRSKPPSIARPTWPDN